MSGRISIDNLSDSLKEMIENSGMTEEQIIELLKSKGINELQTNSKNVIDAINELFQNANNGKELIANAIGEPVSADDTFNAMSNDINSLLSTFKTNMMKNGVTVESGDKFKALIDKIATMVEEGGGKGLQFVTGTGTMTISSSTQPFSSSGRIDNLPFTPTYVICYLPGDVYVNGSTSYLSHAIVSNITTTKISAYSCVMSVTINGNSFNISTTSSGVIAKATSFTYYAIGVGEEDTTLRDSLANILEDKGVDISPEDDMATLIGKVDGIQGSSLDIISATELPATGKQNQICVITDNPVDKFLITTISEEKSSDGITLYLNNTSSSDILTGTTLPITIGNLTTNYHFSKVYHYNDTRLSSYYYSGSQWNELTKAFIPILEKGVQKATSIVGSLNLGNSSSWYYSSTYNAICCTGSSSNNIVTSFTKKINFGDYSKIEVYAFEDGAVYPELGIYSYTTAYNNTYMNTLYYVNISTNKIKAPFLGPAIYTFDISSWTGEYYLCIASLTSSSSIYIQDILLY